MFMGTRINLETKHFHLAEKVWFLLHTLGCFVSGSETSPSFMAASLLFWRKQRGLMLIGSRGEKTCAAWVSGMHYTFVSQLKNTSPHNIELPMWSDSPLRCQVTEGSRNRTLIASPTTDTWLQLRKVRMQGNETEADGIWFIISGWTLADDKMQYSHLKNQNTQSRHVISEFVHFMKSCI